MLIVDIARTLYKLFTKSKWNEQFQEAYDVEKKALATTPILKAPNWDFIFHVHTYASNFAIGCVLPLNPGRIRWIIQVSL